MEITTVCEGDYCKVLYSKDDVYAHITCVFGNSFVSFLCAFVCLFLIFNIHFYLCNLLMHAVSMHDNRKFSLISLM